MKNLFKLRNFGLSRKCGEDSDQKADAMDACGIRTGSDPGAAIVSMEFVPAASMSMALLQRETE